ncbi:hypothetical protein [Mesorhizobium temperatum]|uniref:Uncharacterized protein n=1 Tax=Mesorhizobium temperatum TaxID=241416 RepID=A0A271LN80_9HYPH|nr:hypothetical protein [Mesorhizobium temperatum]PAQ09544.1 hypothetical protein CIT26_13555 [Mesorhizobium temperatum]
MTKHVDETNVIKFPQREFVRIWKGEVVGEGIVYIIDSVVGEEEAGIAYFHTIEEVKANLPNLVPDGMRLEWDIDDEKGNK